MRVLKTSPIRANNAVAADMMLLPGIDRLLKRTEAEILLAAAAPRRLLVATSEPAARMALRYLTDLGALLRQRSGPVRRVVQSPIR